jgi:hypothetical protein
MARSASIPALLTLLLGPLACAKPDSVELGGACKQQVECKEPSDTCMTLGSELLCTMACSAKTACPDDYACARMDVRVEGEGGGGAAGAQGYCLAKSRVGSHIVTIAPEGEGGGKRKSKGKRKGDAD